MSELSQMLKSLEMSIKEEVVAVKHWLWICGGCFVIGFILGLLFPSKM